MKSDHEEESEGSNNIILADKYMAAVNYGAFQPGFGSSKPGQNYKNGEPLITIINGSRIYEIGVSWCCCTNAPECNM